MTNGLLYAVITPIAPGFFIHARQEKINNTAKICAQEKTMRMTRQNFTPNRDEYILKCCHHKKVLHIGACDAPYTIEKHQEGNLLHAKVEDVAKKQIGIDVDQEGIKIMSALGFDNIIHFDMNRLDDLDYRPDVIIFGETIEHLMNLEVALDNLKKIMSIDTLLIISTPNFITLSKIFASMLGREIQHHDHNVIFSMSTLETLFQKTGFEIMDRKFTFLNNHGKGLWGKLDKLFAKVFPVFSSTLLFAVKK